MSIAFNTLRTNKKYQLTNYGEQYEFSIVKIVSDEEFLLKDLHTLDEYYMSEVVGQGQGNDFSIWEI